MSIASITKRTLAMEIAKVDEKAEYITRLKDEAIDTLMQQKKSLLEGTFSGDVRLSTVDHQLEGVRRQTTDVLKQYSAKQDVVHEEKTELDELQAQFNQIDNELKIIQERHEIAFEQLQEKRRLLEERLQSIERLDTLISGLEKMLYEAQGLHGSKMEELRMKKEELLRQTDKSPSEIAVELAQLESEMDERERKYTIETNEKRDQIEALINEANLSVETLQGRRDTLQEDICRLEKEMLNASPSRLLEIENQLATVRGQMEEFDNLIAMANLSSREKLMKLLEGRGLSLTPSGKIRTGSGRILTLEEAKRLGFLEGLDDMLMQLFGLNFTPSGRILTASGRLLNRSEADRLGLLKDFEAAFAEPSESVSLTSSSGSSMSGMSSSDVHYLKRVLGVPLTLALAEITAKQPRDPIHYLGHWLFKYRYNQEVDVRRKKELEELMRERDRLANLAMRQCAEEEAKMTLMEILERVDMVVARHEIEEQLRRIEAETAMEEAENEELEMEALDTLGVYGGPTSGQKL